MQPSDTLRLIEDWSNELEGIDRFGAEAVTSNFYENTQRLAGVADSAGIDFGPLLQLRAEMDQFDNSSAPEFAWTPSLELQVESRKVAERIAIKARAGEVLQARSEELGANIDKPAGKRATPHREGRRYADGGWKHGDNAGEDQKADITCAEKGPAVEVNTSEGGTTTNGIHFPGWAGSVPESVRRPWNIACKIIGTIGLASDGAKAGNAEEFARHADKVEGLWSDLESLLWDMGHELQGVARGVEKWEGMSAGSVAELVAEAATRWWTPVAEAVAQAKYPDYRGATPGDQEVYIDSLTEGDLVEYFGAAQDAARVKWSGASLQELCIRLDQEVSRVCAEQGGKRKAESVDGGRGAVAEPDESQPIKPPSEKALQAWRLKTMVGLKTQQDIADAMIQQGVPATQGDVSRWLKEVKACQDTGYILPDPPHLDSKPQSIDPAVIEMGARQDGRTPRQRARRDPDAD